MSSESKKTTVRESNLELLRIVSILIIILSHYVGHSGFDFTGEGLSFNRLFVESFRLGAVGVDIFVLISGYFLVSSEFKASKFIRLECEILFYSIVLGITFFLATDLAGMKDLIYSFFPSLSNSYWFISTYLLLYLLSPFLNKLIHALNQKWHARLLIILYAVYVLIPTVTNFTLAGTSNIMLFFMLYLTAAYYHLYGGPMGTKTAGNFLMALLSFLFIACSTMLFDILNTRFGIMRYDASYFTSAYSLPVILCALGLFLGFKNLKISYHPAINWISGCTLGIYLLHDNNFMRTFLWKHLLSCQNYQNSAFLALHAIICVVAVFTICLLIDKVRIALIERPLFKLFSAKLSAFDQKFLS